MTLPSVGPAVCVAAHDARSQLLEVAAQMLGIARESMEIHERLFHSPALQEPVCPDEPQKSLPDLGQSSKVPPLHLYPEKPPKPR
jgi:hypothetical protein